MKPMPLWLRNALSLFVGLSAFALFLCVLRWVPGFVSKAATFTLPVTVGLCTGYVFLFPVRMLENAWGRTFPKSSVQTRTVMAVTIVFTLFFGLLAACILLLIPALYRNVIQLGTLAPGYVKQGQEWLDGVVANYPIFQAPEIRAIVDEQLAKGAASLQAFAMQAAGDVFSFAYDFLITMANVFFGFIAAIYLLIERRSLGRSLKRLLHAMLGEKRLGSFLSYLHETDVIFGRFLAAKLLECLIVFIISWPSFALIGLPYAPLLAAITAVFNLIPYLGPIVAFFITLLVTLLATPDMVLWMTIICILLQVLDEFVLVPVLFGERLKMSGFLVIVSVSVFGGLFGMWGMMLSVPFFALLIVSIQRMARNIQQRKANGGIPPEK